MSIQARYTEVLYNLLQNERTKKAIDEAMSEYPVYKPENEFNFSIIPTREEINKRILDHYKYREIGFETVGRFIDELRISLNEIMPFYYQLFKTEDVMNGLEDIFGNLDVIESYEENSTGSTNSNFENNSIVESETNANSSTNMTNQDKNVKSLTPQGQLSITNKQIDQVHYADEINWNKSDSESTGENTETNNTNTTNNSSGSNSAQNQIKHTLTRKGNQGVNTYAHDMGELRNIFMNIMDDIINNPRIVELFMLVD